MNQLLLSASHSCNLIIYCLSSKSFRKIVYAKTCCRKPHLPSRFEEPLLSLRFAMGSTFTLQDPRARKPRENAKKTDIESENDVASELISKDDTIEKRPSLSYLQLEAPVKRKLYKHSKMLRSTTSTFLHPNTLSGKNISGSCSELNISFV